MMTDDPLPDSQILNSADGLQIFCQIWLPEASPMAALVLVHGVGEHSGRYEHVAQYFKQKGYAVFALDLRGHGHSEGKRGHVAQFNDYVVDVQTLVTYAHQATPDVPIFLVGHSLGGLITVDFALKHPDEINALILSSPGLQPKANVPVWKTALGNLSANFFPELSLDNGLDPNHVSRDEAVVSAYIEDPLVHAKLSAKWFVEYNATRNWVMEEANTLSVPILILQAGEDLIVDADEVKVFFERVGLDDKHYIEYPDLYHEIFNEPENQDVFGDIEAWLVPRLQPHTFDTAMEPGTIEVETSEIGPPEN